MTIVRLISDTVLLHDTVVLKLIMKKILLLQVMQNLYFVWMDLGILLEDKLVEVILDLLLFMVLLYKELMAI